MDEDLQTDVVYTNIYKAFDNIDHNLIIKKLHFFIFYEFTQNLF